MGHALPISGRNSISLYTSVCYNKECMPDFSYEWIIPFTYTTSAEKKFNQTEADVVWIKSETEGAHALCIQLNLIQNIFDYSRSHS